MVTKEKIDQRARQKMPMHNSSSTTNGQSGVIKLNVEKIFDNCVRFILAGVSQFEFGRIDEKLGKQHFFFKKGAN